MNADWLNFKSFEIQPFLLLTHLIINYEKILTPASNPFFIDDPLLLVE